MPAAPQMQIELIPIDNIKPYWNNPRKNDAAVPLVRESIGRYGFQQPLVVDKDGVIIVGHTRYRAAREIGMDKVPCIRAKLSAKKAREYRIADNKAAEPSLWDNQALATELRALSDGFRAFDHDGSFERLLKVPALPGAKSTAQMDRILNRQGADILGKQLDKAQQVEVECPHCGESFWLDPVLIGGQE